MARAPVTSLIFENYKLVKSWDKGRLELFDLSKDLGESEDLSKAKPKKTKELHAHMLGFLKEVEAETRKTGTKAEVYKNARPE